MGLKIDMYRKHELLLKTIYYLGDGLMFAYYIEKFTPYAHKTQMWRDINELEKSGLVEKIKYHKHTIVKIKSFAIKMILGKDKVDSIKVTGYKILKSAMVCGVILSSFQHACKNAEDYLYKVKKYSNLYYSNDLDVFLLNQIANSMAKHDMNCGHLKSEIDKLSKILPKNMPYIKNYKSLNIFIEKYGYRKATGDYWIYIAILDMTSDIIPTSMAQKILDVHSYYTSIFDNQLQITGSPRIHFLYNFYTRDETRLVYARQQLKKVEPLIAKAGIDQIQNYIQCYELQLTSTVLSNQKIIV